MTNGILYIYEEWWKTTEYTWNLFGQTTQQPLSKFEQAENLENTSNIEGWVLTSVANNKSVMQHVGIIKKLSKMTKNLIVLQVD